MKVKIGNLLTFDPDEVQVAIHLTKEDREQIANMAEDAAIYCQYPDSMDPAVVADDLNTFRQEVENNG